MEKKTKDVEMELRGMLSLDEQNEELRKENLSLKRQIGGYKRANKEYRSKVKDLQILVAEKESQIACLQKEIKEKTPCNTVTTTKFAELEQSLESKNALIDSLKEKIQDLVMKKSELERKVENNDEIVNEYEETIAELRKPWWKRFF